MVSVTSDRVRKLNLKQIHELATEQYELMSTPEYKDVRDHTERYRDDDRVIALRNAFHATKDFTVVGDYALDAIITAGIAESHRDEFTDDELEVMEHSWSELFSNKRTRGSATPALERAS